MLKILSKFSKSIQTSLLEILPIGLILAPLSLFSSSSLSLINKTVVQ